jgi:hypothetical protein
MSQRSGRARFILEALQPRSIGIPRIAQHLDGDFSTNARVPRTIHIAHASGIEPASDFVRTHPHSRSNRSLVSHVCGVPCQKGTAEVKLDADQDR